MDLPVAVVDVDRVLEERRELGERHAVGLVEARLEVLEVALHLRHQPVAPPVGEVLAVDRQDGVEVLAHLRRRSAASRGTRAP